MTITFLAPLWAIFYSYRRHHSRRLEECCWWCRRSWGFLILRRRTLMRIWYWFKVLSACGSVWFGSIQSINGPHSTISSLRKNSNIKFLPHNQIDFRLSFRHSFTKWLYSWVPWMLECYASGDAMTVQFLGLLSSSPSEKLGATGGTALLFLDFWHQSMYGVRFMTLFDVQH